MLVPVTMMTDDQRPDPMLAASLAVSRARRLARDKGLRPGSPSATARTSRAGDRLRRGVATDKDGRDPRLVGDAVDRLLVERGWGSEVQVGSVIGRWEQIVGAHVADHVVPVEFTGTTLTVRADSTAWATQMRLLVSSVLTRIESEIGEGLVTEIVVQGPGGPSWRKGPLTVRGRGPRDTYG